MSGPRNTVICRMCGGKFFPASLKFHEKACKKKQQYLEIPCSYCDEMVRKADMDVHLRRCSERKASERRQRKGGGGGGVRGFTGGGSVELGKSAEHLMKSSSLPTLGRSGPEKGTRTYAPPTQIQQPEADGRIPCAVCGRKFAADRIGTHQKICRKIKSKGDVEEFDMTAKRTKEINEELSFAGGGRGRRGGGGGKKGTKAKFINSATRFGGKGSGGTMASHIESQEAGKKKSKWRAQHESFIANVRNAKKISSFLKNGGEAKDLANLPLLETTNNGRGEIDNYVFCEHCGRSYSEEVARRHIPKCKNIVNRPKPPPGGGFKLNRGTILPKAENGMRVHKPQNWGR